MALPLSLHPIPEGAASAAPVAPLSCITGASKDVLRNIQLGALSDKARYFLTMIAIESFGNAGWQKQQHLPNPGVWCRFHLSAWAEEHSWSRQYAWRIREQMVALGILFYEPDPTHPEQGILRWNLDFSAWQVLDDRYRRQRYTRRGAGRPRKAPAAAQAPEQIGEHRSGPNIELLQESGVSQTKSNVLHTPGKSNRLQKQSNVLQITRATEIKRVTPACAEAPQEGAPDGALRKELRKKERNNASSDDDAAPGASPAPLKVHLKPEEDTSRSASGALLASSKGLTPIALKQRTAAAEAREAQQGTAATPPARSRKQGKKTPTPEEQGVADRAAALRAIWLAHPHPHVVKPACPSGWSPFNKGIRLLAEDDVPPEQLGALMEAMLTWSRGTYLATPLKMHHNLDEVQLTRRQLDASPQKGPTHAPSQTRAPGLAGAGYSGSGIDPTIFLIRPGQRAEPALPSAGTTAPGPAVSGV